MHVETDRRAESQLRDVAALLALPRMWRDRDAAFIVRSLVDVLASLLRLDRAHVSLSSSREGPAFECAHPRHLTTDDVRALVEAPSGQARMLKVPGQFEDLTALFVATAARSDFPTHFERFLSSLAVEQAMLAVHASRLVTNLSKANAAKSTFLATMSHELRTPLNAVIGYAELLHGGFSGDLNDQQRQHLNRIDAAARHLLGLIEGILAFARLEAGKERVELVDADASRISDDVIALIEPLARTKGLGVRALAQGDDLRMRTDSGKVRQILLNLMSNAVKFTPSGSVEVQVKAEAEGVTWTVKDTGSGIAPEDLDGIFEPFQQANHGNARPPGTGLGLSVSRQLARLLGGDVTVASTPREGSTFTLRLPRTAPSP